MTDIKFEHNSSDDEEGSAPRFGFNVNKKASQEDFGIIKFVRGNNKGGLGFVDDNSLSDLNKAIDSLDNTQFRNSIKAGSGSKASVSNNDLSQELPV